MIVLENLEPLSSVNINNHGLGQIIEIEPTKTVEQSRNISAWKDITIGRQLWESVVCDISGYQGHLNQLCFRSVEIALGISHYRQPWYISDTAPRTQPRALFRVNFDNNPFLLSPFSVGQLRNIQLPGTGFGSVWIRRLVDLRLCTYVLTYTPTIRASERTCACFTLILNTYVHYPIMVTISSDDCDCDYD